MSNTSSVCIIDDKADYRFLMQLVMSRFFPAHSVSIFVDGCHFLGELPGFTSLPDLILLDRHMPNLDGHQTLLFLKTHPDYKKIPVIMISAEASAAEVNTCYEAGANSFLYKPVDFNRMKELLTVVFDYWLKTNQKPVANA